MARHRPSKGCVTITTAIALAVCMRMLMSGVVGLIDASHAEGEWIKVDALIVGINGTTFSTQTFASQEDIEKMYYCARVEFSSHFGENITAISNTDCVLDPFIIDIGTYIAIAYNPAYPQQFIEQDVLETDLISLKVMVGVGATISILLSGILCLLLNRQRRWPPLYMEDSTEALPAASESPEERKEKILSKLHTATVLEDSSNTMASSIRSTGELDPSGDKAKEASGGGGAAAPPCNNNEQEEKSKDYDENDTSQENHVNSANPEPSYRASGTMSFLSSLTRPNHDTECCICLGHYEPGEVICASKSEECNHVFHKECLISWMMKNNDKCPLCRVDFMKEDEDPEA